MQDHESDSSEGVDARPHRDALVEQAVSAMVHQFARPLEFLRELVQNAVDAGSPRIAIAIEQSHAECQDVVAVRVQDWGRGMDERVIDQELTCLFASAKDRDLAAIGRFGIGFTSVFAIGPDAVLVRTGCRDEAWELLFHADRSYDKVRLGEPVTGTVVTVFKSMAPDRVPGFVEECRYTLRFWCEHVTVPITFDDRRAARTPTEPSPFAAFGGVVAADPEPERIDRPLGLGCSIAVEHRGGNVHVALGYTDSPRYAFYRGGLTLVRTASPDVLGGYAESLGRYALKVDSTGLEHTLTRDSVRHGRAFDLVMEVVHTARARLLAALVDALEAAVVGGDDLTSMHRWLAAELERDGLQVLPGLVHRAVLRDVFGRGVSLAAVDRQAGVLGAVLVADPRADAELIAHLDPLGVTVLPEEPSVRAVVRACPRLSAVLRLVGRLVDVHAALGPRTVQRARTLYRVAVPVVVDGVDGHLFSACAELLGAAGMPVVLVPCRGAVEAGELCAEIPEDLGLFRTRTRGRWPGRTRVVALDPRHPHVRALCAVAVDRLDLAALALAQAMALTLDLGGPGRLARLAMLPEVER